MASRVELRGALRLGLAVAAAIVLSGGLAAQDAEAQTVKVGNLGIVADGPYYIAIEKGYFKEQHITVELARFNSAAQAIAPLSTNQVQVVGGGLSAALFNAFARGWPVRIVMARTRDVPGDSANALLVREDLKGSVKTLKDLKGRKVAVNAPSATLHFMLGKMMESVGLTINDVNIVYMPWPNMGPAFESKAIDAGTAVEPFIAQYDERKIAFPFKRAADVLTKPRFEVSVILYSMDWADANPDQAKAFTVAYLKGVRDYYDALKDGPKRKEVVDILMKYTPLKEPKLYDHFQWDYIDPNAEFDAQSLVQQQDWYAQQGSVPKKANIDDMIDSRFINFAIQKLGRVKSN